MKQRCRFTRPTSNIWAAQCEHPAKGDRVIVFATGESLPACGVHLNARYAYPYRRSETSLREAPVQEFMAR